MNSFIGFLIGIIHSIAAAFGAPATQMSPSDLVNQYVFLPHGTATNTQQAVSQTAKSQDNSISQFSAMPMASQPLTIMFSGSDSDASEHLQGNYYIEFGDGKSDAAQDSCNSDNTVCTISASHTYASPNTYTASLFWAKVWPSNFIPEKIADVQITIGSTTVSVPGMSKYTDSNFGFSFWYPSGWTIDMAQHDIGSMGKTLEDCTLNKTFSVHGSALSNGVSINEYYCPNRSITLRGAGGANPVGMDFKYYFDTDTHTWMETDLSDPPNGSPRTTRAADVSNNTMGGLHIFPGEARFGANEIIPLSAKNFLMISTNDVGGYIQEGLFAKTILATDPSVATPVSTQQQIAAIEAEKSAYRPDESITIDKSSLMASPGKPIIRGTAKGLQAIGIRVADMHGDYIFGSGRVAVDAMGNWQVQIENDWQAELSPGSGTQLPPGQYIVYAATDVNDTQAAADSGVLNVSPKI